jgi:hypothetical protein
MRPASAQNTPFADAIAAHGPLAGALVGLGALPPLGIGDMAAALEVTFLPPHRQTRRLEAAAGALRASLANAGARIIPFEDALRPDGKIRPGIVIVEQGEGAGENLAIHYLASLYLNPLVILLDGPAPAGLDGGPQDILDAIAGQLAWHLTHLPVFIGETEWIACTMNGAVLRGSTDDIDTFITRSLVPKLAAQVAPPRRDMVTLREGAFEPLRIPGARRLAEDFALAGEEWAANGLMLAHTSLEALAYRDRRARRIVAAYLDQRTGMSYGFLLRQLPAAVRPALPREDAPAAVREALASSQLARVDGTAWAAVTLQDQDWAIEVPDVWVVSTRSGCKKTEVDPARDLVRMGLEGGRIVLETPAGTPPGSARPSYDTLVMLTHAVGNVLVASLQRAISPQSAPLADALAGDGPTASHWHGYVAAGTAPAGFASHGADNPPVSCSTPQSAVYALAGKLAAYEASLGARAPFAGDVHVEPHHGTNLVGVVSLVEAARWASENDPASALAPAASQAA